MQLIAYGAQDCFLYDRYSSKRSAGVGPPGGVIAPKHNKTYKKKEKSSEYLSAIERKKNQAKHLERINRRKKMIKMQKEGCNSAGYAFEYHDRYEKPIYFNEEIVSDDDELDIEHNDTNVIHNKGNSAQYNQNGKKKYLSKQERKSLKRLGNVTVNSDKPLPGIFKDESDDDIGDLGDFEFVISI